MYDDKCYANHSVYDLRVDLLFNPDGSRWRNDSASMLAWATLRCTQSSCRRCRNGK